MKVRIYDGLKLITEDETLAQAIESNELKEWLHYNNVERYMEMTKAEIVDELRSLGFILNQFKDNNVKVFSSNGVEFQGLEKFELYVNKIEFKADMVALFLEYGSRELNKKEYKR